MKSNILQGKFFVSKFCNPHANMFFDYDKMQT